MLDEAIEYLKQLQLQVQVSVLFMFWDKYLLQLQVVIYFVAFRL